MATAEKNLTRLKGLQAQMRPGERPLFSMPVIWESLQDKQSQACDLVLTDQRVFGYIYTRVPRERLFLDALELASIQQVSLRQKNYQAVFNELLLSDGEKKILVRSTRKKIQQISERLRQEIAAHSTDAQTALADSDPGEQAAEQTPRRGPSYREQKIRRPLERSPLGITLLLVGGLAIEVLGLLVWLTTASLQTGLPLFVAGLVAVITATFMRRQLR